MESTKQQRILFCVLLDLVFCFCFVITAWVSSSACFLVNKETGSCIDQHGAHNLFAISQGQSFHLGISALLFAGHGYYAFKTLRAHAQQHHTTSAFAFGILLGSYGLVTLFALCNSAIWGSYSAIVSELDCGALPSLENGTIALKCNGYNAAFSALSVLSSLIFLCNFIVTILLFRWQTVFLPHGGIVLSHAEDMDEEIASAPSPVHRRVGGAAALAHDQQQQPYESMMHASSPELNTAARVNIFSHSAPPSHSQFEPLPTHQQLNSDVEESFLSTDNN